MPTRLLVALVFCTLITGHAQNGVVIHAPMYHLGDTKITDWPGIAEQPQSSRLDFKFQASANPNEVVLAVKHRDVDDFWFIEINGRSAGHLKFRRALNTYFYPVPSGVLRDGENELSILPTDKRDDIAIGEFQLINQPLNEFLSLGSVELEITDAKSRRLIPVRIGLARTNETLVEVYYADKDNTTAVRTGIIYARGRASFQAPAGDYLLYVNRGMEYSRVRRMISIKKGTTQKLKLELKQEVDTKGYIASDTHIHTYEISGHGDATLDERVLTIAGEGVELAIATDHNHHADYIPHQTKLGLNHHFRSVTGNEVTTANGHFNAFPMQVGSALPNHKETNWVMLVNDIRSKGAEVVILNHPRWPDIARGPFGVFGLNRGSGERANGPEFTFDAMELANATAPLKDPLYLFHDWFALLNYGERIWAVGSSDTHTVGDPVGQGRTYVQSKSDDPMKINLKEIYQNFREGRTSISQGIFTEIWVNGNQALGRTIRTRGESLRVELRVASASWIRPRTAHIFLNGGQVASMEVPRQEGSKVDARLRFDIPNPEYDAHLVAVVVGDPIKEAGWRTEAGFTLGASNPCLIDVDGNGYKSPRETARQLKKQLGNISLADLGKVTAADPGLGVQLYSLLEGPRQQMFEDFLIATAATNSQFALYLKHRPASH